MAGRLLRLLRINSGLVQGRQRLWSSFNEQWAAEEKHAKTTMVTWRRISLFVGLPVVSYLTWKHLIVAQDHEETKEYFSWPHLRLRNKPFPWGDGDTSLFHNPHANPGPEKEESQPKRSFRETMNELWLTYLHDDPEKRDKFRWDHLARMEKRKEEYLAKKKAAIDKEVPLQPMDLFTEVKYTPVNEIDSEMEN